MSFNHTAHDLETRYTGGSDTPGFPRIVDALLREGRLEEAIALADSGIRKYPELLTGFLVLGRCHQQAGKLDEAKTQFEMALRLDPRCPSARRHLAQIAEQLQWKSVALEHWRMLCDIEPWDEAATEAYGRMLREAPGVRPAAKLSTSYPAELSEATPVQHIAASMPEFHLDESDNFATKDDGSFDDLAAALPSGSEWSIPALTDPIAEPVQALTQAPIVHPEPSPVDLLKDDVAAEKEQSMDQGAPFTGEDVESRLDDLFGLGGEKTVLPEAQASALEEAPTGESAAYTEAAETGYLEGPSPVQGDDVAQRLDHLFEASETKAEAKNFTAEAISTWTPVVPTPKTPDTPEPAESEARAAGESSFLPASLPETTLNEDAQPDITGEDIANRLDALFEESDTASSIILRPETDDSFEARETMVLSLESVLGPNNKDKEPIPEILIEDPPAFNLDVLETVDLKPTSETRFFATEDTLSPESLGLPPMDGEDVSQRLDAIFGTEAETRVDIKTDASPQIQVEPETGLISILDPGDDLATSESGFEVEDMSPLETALAPSPETAFDAPFQGEPVVSGDDISSRLAEIFGDTGDQDEIVVSPDLTSEEVARGTHYEFADMPTMMIRAGGADVETEAEPQDVAFEDETQSDEDELIEPATTSIATVTLAEIYFNQGLKEQALQIYRQLLEREPDNESVRKRVEEIEAFKAEGDDKGSGPDDSRPRPGLKIPRRKK